MFQPDQPIRQNSRHSDWETERMRRGVCTKCSEPIAPTSGRFCEVHRVAHNERSRQRYLANRELANYRTKISGHRMRVRVMVQLGGLFCAWCGEDDYRVLSIDHVNGHDRPTAERTRYRSGLTGSDYGAIERGEVTDVRVLCANCQARNEHLRGNRTVYPEIREAVLAAGGRIGGLERVGEEAVGEEAMVGAAQD